MSKTSNYAAPSRPRSALYFDIETEGRQDALELMDESEFAAPATYKDPEKIAAKVAENKAKALRDAALSAMTGRILVIAYATDDGEVQIIEGDEKKVVETFLIVAKQAINGGNRIFGYNVLGFDLPFIGQRAAILGVQVPLALYTFWKGRFQWAEHFVDLMELVKFGHRDFKGYSLKNVARVMGLEFQKTGDGSAFSGLYRDDRDKALEYVKRDVECTRALAKRLYAI